MQVLRTLSIVLFISFSCSNSSGDEKLDTELQLLLNSFIKEGQKRGLKIQPNNLVVEFGRIDGKKSASCKPNSVPKVITLDRTTWNHITYPQKESLFFHELAHCLLMKPHNNTAFIFGECQSWMREDESKCSIDLSNSEWRRYYLDEMFSSSKVSDPFWYYAKSKLKNAKDLKHRKSFILQPYQFHFFDSLSSNKNDSWAINFNARASEGSNYLGIVINNIAIDAGFINDSDITTAKLVFSHLQPRKTVYETTSIGQTLDIFLAKEGNVIFIYLGGKICYLIPVDPAEKLHLGATCSFPKNSYTINLFSR